MRKIAARHISTELYEAIYNSRTIRKFVRQAIILVHRYPTLIPAARAFFRLLPSWITVHLHNYHYRLKMSSHRPDLIGRQKTDNRWKRKWVRSKTLGRLQSYAMRGQLTKGWYGGRELNPEETCLARDCPPREIVELGKRAYEGGSEKIQTYYSDDDPGVEGLLGLRYCPVDEFRSFLAERRVPCSVAEMSDCGGYTIVTPFYKHLDFFEETAVSVDLLFQGEKDFALEWVVVNDDPNVADTELARRIPERLFPLVRQFRTKSGGIVDALNTGIRHSRYRWILFLDCDDVIEPNAIFVLNHYRTLFPCCRYISSSIIDIDESGNVFRYRGNEHPIDRLFDIGMLAGHLKAIRRDLFDDAGGLDVRFELCQDYEFALRTAMQEPILKIPEPLYRYRWHGRTQSVSRARLQWAVHLRIQREYMHRFLALGEGSDSVVVNRPVSRPAFRFGVPRGAVIVRTRGERPGLLLEAVDSIRVQAPCLTPVVVVHGGRDALRSVETRLSGTKGTIVLHASEESKPGYRPGYLANVGLDYVAGQAGRFDYVGFLDDGDIYYPCFAEWMGEALTWSGADIVYAMANKRRPGRLAEAGTTPLPACCLVAANFITVNSFVLTTAFLCRSGARFDEHLLYLDDWDFLLSLWSMGAVFHFLPETVSEFCITNDGTIARKKDPELYAAAVTRLREKAWGIAEAEEEGLARFRREMLDFERPQTREFNERTADLAHDIWMKTTRQQ